MCQIFINLELVATEIYEPKDATKSQKQQNLRKFLIFFDFIQLWIFTLTTNI